MAMSGRKTPHLRHRAALLWIVAISTSMAGWAAAPQAARAAPPPSPLLWQRTYVEPGGQVSNDEFQNIIVPQCGEDLQRGTRSNGASGPGVPTIAVVGDSTEVQTRRPAMADAQIHYEYATHCGEELASLAEEGRLSDALATNPDALVFGIGTNDLSYYWQVRRDRLGEIVAKLNRVLDLSEGARCRVLMNLPVATPPWVSGQAAADWLWLTQQVNQEMLRAAAARHNLHVADWASRIAWYWPAYLQDGQHHTPTGINERINLEIETARQCWAPDSPTAVGASSLDRAATVWWDPLPEPERASQYRVTAFPSGRSVTTTQATVNLPGLTDGIAYQFVVEAINGAGSSEPSGPSAAVVPSATGARFHPRSPQRIMDTRSGLGGKAGPFGPQETYALPVSAAVPSGASAVMLNVTATGQTEQTFVTVWPGGGQTRPLASNLNPRPGIDAVPAMVTARLGTDGKIQLFNNSGRVQLVVDVVGWYELGSPTGALFAPLTPQRVLDTRTGKGGKQTLFGAGETFDLDLGPLLPQGASAALLNITTTNTTGPTHLTVWPAGQDRPVASTLNPQPGLTRANLTAATLGQATAVSLYNNSASTDVVVDLVGYFGPAGASTGGSLYYPATPERAYDSRDGTGGLTGKLTGAVALPFSGRGVVPADAIAVDLNITSTDQPSSGHLSVWPTWQAQPDTSMLNFGPRDVVANRALAGLGGGALNVAPAGSASHVVIDLAGWFGPLQ